jgi:hypothetical protein
MDNCLRISTLYRTSLLMYPALLAWNRPNVPARNPQDSDASDFFDTEKAAALLEERHRQRIGRGRDSTPSSAEDSNTCPILAHWNRLGYRSLPQSFRHPSFVTNAPNNLKLEVFLGGSSPRGSRHYDRRTRRETITTLLV